jgi:hypothetical protein
MGQSLPLSSRRARSTRNCCWYCLSVVPHSCWNSRARWR